MKKGMTKIMCKIPVIITKEGSTFIAYTPAFDLSSCGASFEEAKINFNEALDLFLEEVVKMGTLETVLEECGWKKIRSSKSNKCRDKSHWVPPAIVSRFDTDVFLPC